MWRNFPKRKQHHFTQSRGTMLLTREERGVIRPTTDVAFTPSDTVADSGSLRDGGNGGGIPIESFIKISEEHYEFETFLEP